MGNNFVLSVATTLLLLLLLSPPRIAADPVLDIDGNPVEAYKRYHIMSTIRPRGGLKAVHKPDQPKCPLFALQVLWFDNATPVIFTHPSSKKNTIEESTDVHISFVGKDVNGCYDGTWRLTTDPGNGKTLVSTGGFRPEPQARKNLFKIEKLQFLNLSYKITYCPTPEVGELEVCGDLGYVVIDNWLWYGVSDRAVDFYFVKA